MKDRRERDMTKRIFGRGEGRGRRVRSRPKRSPVFQMRMDRGMKIEG
jgi:hypothetical protein